MITCGDQYKGLTCTTASPTTRSTIPVSAVYQWTGTTIEEAVVKGALYVTSDDRVIVDVLTGEGESGYEGLTALLSDNAYQVNEVSLLTGQLVLSEWGMALNKGYLYETNEDTLWRNDSVYTFLTAYTDKYVENLKNNNIPVVTNFAQGVTITDSNTAHALLNTSEGAGIYPLDADDSFDAKANVKGEAIAVAAEGEKAGTEEYSRVIVFSSSTMLSKEILDYYSFNNGAYFMNVVNTIADKDDDTVVIESKSLESASMGAPTASTNNVILIIFVFVIPAAVLIVGMILWIRRRNR